MLYEVGDYVKCLYEPLYWDGYENDTNAEDLEEESLVPEGEHPGFNEYMYHMIHPLTEYTVEQVHDFKPWVGLADSEGRRWWWHIDWISKPLQSKIVMTEADNNSKYKSVILKIKKMQETRERKGYAF